MASVTCYGGIKEIGGNKFLVEDKGTRIFLDFGQSFTHLNDYFAEYLQPRTRFGLRDYFALDLMPKLKGLYNPWAVEKTDVEYCSPEYQGVFISHAHYDHLAHLRFLDQKIPIYMGETTKAIISSANKTAKSQMIYETEGTARDGTPIPANIIRTFRTGDRMKVDSIEVEPVHVDHSVPGAYGFIVRTSEGTVVYTGDIRRHGTRPELTADFMEKARESEPDILIIEGTRVCPEEKRQNFSEPEVYSRSLEVVEKNGFTLAMRYPKDLDRFRTFHEVAKKTGRKLLISLKTAHLLISLKDDKALALPDPFADGNIEVYKRKMKIYKTWELPMLDKCVDQEWVKKNDRILWELDFFNLTELIDVKPAGGACIHSMSEPFEEDPMSQIQDEVMKNWLERFSLEHHQLHASGHASMEEIFDMVKGMAPKKVIPVHTQYPDMFKGDIVQAEYGKKIVV